MITENEIIEIIKEEINIVNFDITYGKSIWIDNKDLQNIASAILSKLNRLDRENVKKVLEDVILEYTKFLLSKKLDVSFSYKPFIDQILTLIPPEGEIIAEGRIIDFIQNKDLFTFKYLYKKGKLIFIEDKGE